MNADIQIHAAKPRRCASESAVEARAGLLRTRGTAGRVIEVPATSRFRRRHEIISEARNPDEHRRRHCRAKRIGGAVKEKDIAGRTDFRDRVCDDRGEHAGTSTMRSREK